MCVTEGLAAKEGEPTEVMKSTERIVALHQSQQTKEGCWNAHVPYLLPGSWDMDGPTAMCVTEGLAAREGEPTEVMRSTERNVALDQTRRTYEICQTAHVPRPLPKSRGMDEEMAMGETEDLAACRAAMVTAWP